MEPLAREIANSIGNASWIRRMFEAGIELKRKVGAENVFDFSLGNPDVPPPSGVPDALRNLADGLDRPCALGYMPNAGYPEVRERLAESLSAEQGVAISAAAVILTCGAAGAINTFFRTVLDPGDEVVCPAPYFAEYIFYAANFGGKLVPVKSCPLSFELDLNAIRKALTDRTRVLLLNSPNNPTGVVYREDELRHLSELVRSHSERTGRTVYLLSDEPYRFLNYGKEPIPSLLPLCPNAVVAGSFSKSLSLAGERIGYLIVNPAMPDRARLTEGLVFANRTLGYVNAPAIGQKLMAACLGHEVDVRIYLERRDAMAAVLESAGIRFSLPRGAFYFFPESPIPDDSAFVRTLMEENVLAVPGSGFGYPGYFRLAFCVGVETIRRSAAAFRRGVEKTLAIS
jgi:aspartate aminotransferase